MVDEIAPEELERALEAGEDVRIVDVSTRPEFDLGHIPGSENVPMGSLTERVSELGDAETIVTVCPHGQASKQAVRLIVSYEGIDEDTMVASLSGGMEAWDGAVESNE